MVQLFFLAIIRINYQINYQINKIEIFAKFCDAISLKCKNKKYLNYFFKLIKTNNMKQFMITVLIIFLSILTNAQKTYVFKQYAIFSAYNTSITLSHKMYKSTFIYTNDFKNLTYIGEEGGVGSYYSDNVISKEIDNQFQIIGHYICIETGVPWRITIFVDWDSVMIISGETHGDIATQFYDEY